MSGLESQPTAPSAEQKQPGVNLPARELPAAASAELASSQLSPAKAGKIARLLSLRPRLSIDGIRASATEFLRIHGRLPTSTSREPVPFMPDESWPTIDAAGRRGRRGLRFGSTLASLLADMRLLDESKILEAARDYHARHGKLPTGKNREHLSTYPGTSWRMVDAAGHHGFRGLTAGRPLAAILAPLRKELGSNPRGRKPGVALKPLLSEQEVLEAGRTFFELHGALPDSQEVREVPGLPHETWAAVNQAGQHGLRGLSQGRTLSKILAPLRRELRDTGRLGS